MGLGRSSTLALFSLALFLATGCGDGRPKRFHISGKVLIDGQPVQHGLIQVLPKGNRAASGKIGEDGTFTLGSFAADDGCVPGTHRVSIDGRKSLGMTKQKWFVPPKFSLAGTSGVELVVDGDKDDVLIELESGGSKPFEPYVEVLVRGRSEEQMKAGDSVL